MSKIALVDDDRNILTSVSMTLEAEGFDVETYNDGQAALDAFNKKMPDMAVFDIKMPRMDGMDLLQRVRQKSKMPVIFLTSKDDEIDEVLGLRMGADDYVKKPFSQRLLVERIRALLRRQEAVAGEVVGDTEETKLMTRGSLTMDPLRHAVTWKGQDVSLTVTEFLLLQALAQRPGFVKSRDQLMDVAYDDQVYVDDRTIDSHIKRLRKKMRTVDTDFSAIETLYGIGYRYNEEQVMALAERFSNQGEVDRRDADVVLGDDWVAPDSTVEKELRDSRARRGGLSTLNRSPLTRKIITFNLIALNVLVAGVLWLNSSRDTLAVQRINGLQAQVELIADVFETQFGAVPGAALGQADSPDIAATLAGLDLRQGAQLLVYDSAGFLVGEAAGALAPAIAGPTEDEKPTLITDFLDSLWQGLAGLFTYFASEPELVLEDKLRRMIEAGDPTATRVETGTGAEGETLFHALSPIRQGDVILGTVALVSPAREIDAAVSAERERVLQMFVIATLVSIGLSLVLASTIANPISDLADAAEIGRDRNKKHKGMGRIRIPDLTARPDEIGRLSGALRGMVGALYDRIDSNEQFAADVAHEIKNPLASLRSAIGSLRIVRKDEHRNKLLDVIEHDVRRLDRLVSDISNASRLDSELVKEEEQEFDLLEMLGNIGEFLGQDAQSKGIEFISDLPKRPITISGLEPRLAQVFVNLISNAISFCEDGDAIRVWARKRDNRVLVVVEDTGPGIPEESLGKIFKRFYTSRPQSDFGNNSGLGLAISKQIVEAHGGVIWAENIRPTEADVTSEPLGARFVVGLPV